MKMSMTYKLYTLFKPILTYYKPILIGCLATMLFIGGCQFHKRIHRCPTVVTNTEYVYDTVTHYIYDIWPHYIQSEPIIIHDTVPMNIDIDTVAVIKDYYATHIYDRQWQDSLIQVQVKDFITQNKSIHNEFKYKILRPQTVTYTTVDNSIHYNSYLYLGLSSPFYSSDPAFTNFDVSLDLTYAGPKFLFGAGYTPINKAVTAKIGLKLFKFK